MNKLFLMKHGENIEVLSLPANLGFGQLTFRRNKPHLDGRPTIKVKVIPLPRNIPSTSPQKTLRQAWDSYHKLP